MNSSRVVVFNKQLDSLRAIEIENRKPKTYPFNPNYITDYKGERLGMSLIEIDRLLAFRKQNKFINSKYEFQQVTKVSDTLLNKIAPYFKFPDWVVKEKHAPKELLQGAIRSKNKYKKITPCHLPTNLSAFNEYKINKTSD